MPRTIGSKNKPKQETITFKQLNKRADQVRITELEGLVERQDEAVQQGLDEIAEMRKQVDFYRKQVNHLIALLNIITRGV
jgi:uncharacterized coiled-coil protein SlyX